MTEKFFQCRKDCSLNRCFCNYLISFIISAIKQELRISWCFNFNKREYLSCGCRAALMSFAPRRRAFVLLTMRSRSGQSRWWGKGGFLQGRKIGRAETLRIICHRLRSPRDRLAMRVHACGHARSEIKSRSSGHGSFFKGASRASRSNHWLCVRFNPVQFSSIYVHRRPNKIYK